MFKFLKELLNAAKEGVNEAKDELTLKAEEEKRAEV